MADYHKKLTDIDKLYVAEPGKLAPSAPLAPQAEAPAPQVGVYPQPNGQSYYTMESDYFRNLTPQQQTALVGSAVQPEGMTNAYQPAPMIPLPQKPVQAAPAAAPVAQKTFADLEEIYRRSA